MSRRNLLWVTSVTAISLVCWHAATSAPRDGNYELFRVFVETLDQVEREYVRELDREELFQGGLIGILESVDVDSSYLSPSVYQRAKQRTDDIADVGLHLTLRPSMRMLGPGDGPPVYRQVFVHGVLPGSPAERAGILPGDMLIDIDEHHVARLTLEEVVQRLQGEPDTEVALKLFRGPRQGVERVEPADDEPMDGEPVEPDDVNPDGTLLVSLKRAKITAPKVMGVRHKDDGQWDYWIDEQKGLASVRLPTLLPGTAEKLAEVFHQLREQGVKGLALDLRFTFGGTSDEAFAVADLFLSQGRIASIAGPNFAEQHWDAHGEGTWTDVPVVVLVNRFTAGPAEVVAAALQDHDRARVVGERTLGKGGVTRRIELSDGQSALKLTVATFTRPNGKSLYRRRDARRTDPWGVQPNDALTVSQNPQELVEYLRWRSAPSRDENSAMKTFVDAGLAKAAALLGEQPAEAAASS